MRLTAVFCILALLVAGTAFATKPAIDAKSATEVLQKVPMIPLRTFTESFEVSVPPPAWTLVQTNTVETWVQGASPYDGSYSADCQYDATYSGPQDEWLYYDYTIEAGDDVLTFWMFASTYWAITPYQNYNLFVTINGVEVWNYLDDNNGAVTWTYQQYAVPLSAYMVGETITVGIGYVGYDGAQADFDAITPAPWYETPQPCCPFPTTCVALDYNISENGYVTKPCNGAAAWHWGVPPVGVPTVACDGVPVTNVLYALLPVSAGESVVLGSFDITPVCYCLELCHYYDLESSYDVGNVKVSADNGVTWALVYPFGGYDGINTSTSYPSPCAWNEEAFTGTSVTFVRDCFDLTEYVGQTILVKLDLGTDSWSTTDLGWYIKWAKLGGEEQSPVQNSTWGAIKAMYR